MAEREPSNVIRPAQFATEPVRNPRLRGRKKGTLSFAAALRRKHDAEAAARREEEARRPRAFFRSDPEELTQKVRIASGVMLGPWHAALRAAGLDFVRDECSGELMVACADDPRICRPAREDRSRT